MLWEQHDPPTYDGGAMEGHPGLPRERLSLVLGAAVAVTAAGSLATDLEALGIPVLALKGPPVQRRLFGTDAAYRSADVDMLVHRCHNREARRYLLTAGWMFLPENGMLWRMDRAAAYTRKGVTVDLHWGLHAGFLPPRSLRRLEEAMWQGASRAYEGWYEPRLEPLVVYLAAHAAAAGYARPEPLAQLQLAAEGADRTEVEVLARRAGVWPTVEHAMAQAAAPGEGGPRPLTQSRQLRQAVSRCLRRSLIPGSLRHFARRLRSHAAGTRVCQRSARPALPRRRR